MGGSEGRGGKRETDKYRGKLEDRRRRTARGRGSVNRCRTYGGKYSARRVFEAVFKGSWSQICSLWTKYNYRYTLASVMSRKEPRSQRARARASINREGGLMRHVRGQDKRSKSKASALQRTSESLWWKRKSLGSPRVRGSFLSPLHAAESRKGTTPSTCF